MYHDKRRHYRLGIYLGKPVAEEVDAQGSCLSNHWKEIEAEALQYEGEPDSVYLKDAKEIVWVPEDCGCWVDDNKAVIIKNGTLCPSCHGLLLKDSSSAYCPGCDELYLVK